LAVQRKFKFNKINYLTPAKIEILTFAPGRFAFKNPTPGPAPAMANIVDSFRSPLRRSGSVITSVHRVVAPAPQPEPASRLRSVTREVSFLRSDSRCRRYMSDLSNVTPRYLGSEQKGRISLLYLTLSSRLASFVKMEGCQRRFYSAEL